MAIYLAIILLIGLLSKKASNYDDYIFASRKLTLPAFIATFVTTWYGGILEIGRFTFHNGIITWIIFGLFYYFSALILLKYIAPKIHSNSMKTIPDYFHIYFGYIPGIISSLIVILISSPAPYLMIFATIFMHVYDIPYLYSILIGLFFSIAYLLFGGFKSIIRTDKIQFILMYAGFIMILLNLYNNFGGLDFLISKLPIGHLSFKTSIPVGYLFSWSLISMITLIDPNIFQRVYAVKNKKTLDQGIIISIFFWMIFDFLSITTGLYAAAIIPSESLVASPYLVLSNLVLPPFLNTIFIISLLSIVMSTIDSFTFTSSITIGREIKNNKSRIFNIQIGLVLTSILSIIICLSFKQVIDIWYIFGSIAAATILVPLIKILYNPNYKASYPTTTILLPLIVSILWILCGSPMDIDSMYPGILASLVMNYLS